MPYRFVLDRLDYSDFASGRVFVTAPGHPGFPVRLVSELFQRCLTLRLRADLDSPCTVYDPCCGSAYLLSTLAHLHTRAIKEIIGSDVNPDALSLARRNLALTTMDGMQARIGELKTLYQHAQKESHAAALLSAERLRDHLAATEAEQTLRTRLFQADATQKADIFAHLGKGAVDIVLTDVPYGQLCAWQTHTGAAGEDATPIEQMLEALQPILTTQSIVAVSTDKHQKVAHPAYERCERFQMGKRRLVLLRPRLNPV